MKPVTIAILSHNRSWHMAQCVASIREYTKAKYHIKILDHGSEAEHREHIKQLKGKDLEVVFQDDFMSCLAGRRRFLSHIDTDFCVYLDDDIRVSPHWLENLLKPMRNDAECAAVACNLVQENQQIMSGVRYVKQWGNALIVEQYDTNYEGQAVACCGGATLYRTQALHDTEYREEFAGGYEDWDQTLQMTQELNKTIYGSRATVFHKHMPECKDYFPDRWRWAELMESALAMYERWNIRTGVDKTLTHYIKGGVVISPEQASRAMKVLI